MMTDQAHQDIQWMAQALQLARRGCFSTQPNPRVGCVIVKEGVCVGKGFHIRAGGPHAEVHALRDAGEAARGAMAYVTLEPCSHHGRTGPCADALLAAGITRLVVAMRDPNPQVAGQGIARLQSAGVEVVVGVCEQEAKALNPGFIQRMLQDRPWVRLKMAMSLDGRTAMADGTSQWITGPDARAEVQRLRAQSGAIITGIDSILKDDSRLTVRPEQAGFDDETSLAAHASWRVVLDTHLRVSDEARVLSDHAPTLIVTCSGDEQRIAGLKARGIHVWQQPVGQSRVDLHALAKRLAAELQCNEVLVETGATLAGAWIESGLVDELIVFMAPTLLGSDARPLMTLPLMQMSEQYRLRITDIRAIGHDWKITAHPEGRGNRLS